MWGMCKFHKIIAIVMLVGGSVGAAPVFKYHEPTHIQSIFGVDLYGHKKIQNDPQKQRWIRIYISPFHEHASGARNRHGFKVPEGDRLGRWNMIGLFFGFAASPTDKPFDPTQPPIPSPYPTMQAAYDEINTVIPDGPNILDPDKFKYDVCDDTKNTTGFYTVSANYQRVGARALLGFHPFEYIDFEAGFGVSDYFQDPCYRNAVDSPTSDLDLKIQEFLLADAKRIMIGQEMNINFERYHRTNIEDSFIQAALYYDFSFNDDQGVHVVTIRPLVRVGTWIPTGHRKNYRILWSLPAGNDGHWGPYGELALNIDFLGMLIFQVGGGLTGFGGKTINDYPVPSNKWHFGFVPWYTAIHRTPGLTWRFNLSFCAYHFMDYLSFYFDYVYNKHEKDRFSLKECDPTRAASFAVGIPKLEEESEWRAQTVQFALNYEVTPAFHLGAAVQTHISGVRVYKNHTIMGTATFTF